MKKLSFIRKTVFSVCCALAIIGSVFAVQAYKYSGEVASATQIECPNCTHEATDGTTHYSTLAEAFSATFDGQVEISLLRDASVSSNLTVPQGKDVVFNGNGHTLTRALSGETYYTGTLFTVSKSAKLVLSEVTIDAGNEWVLDEEAYWEAYHAGTRMSSPGPVTAQPGGAVATSHIIKNVSGNLTLLNCVIKNHYGGESCSVLQTTGSTDSKGITILKGTKTHENGEIYGTTITHCYRNGSSVLDDGMTANTEFYIEDGTVIEDNYYGSNGGIIRTDKSPVVMNGGKIINNKGHNSNGSVIMTYGSGSSFTMNGGLISGNSSLVGSSNGRNAIVYLHEAGQFTMNGGIIENNYGRNFGGVDASKTNNKLILNSGTIQNNYTSAAGSDYKSDLGVSYDIDAQLGTGMTINGNCSVAGDLINDGVINGNIMIINASEVPLSGSGTVNGNLTVKYSGDVPPTLPDGLNVTGEILIVNTDAQTLLKFVGAESSKDVAITKGAAIDFALPVLGKTGSLFNGWYTDSALTTPLDVSTFTAPDNLEPDKHTSFYAAYIDTESVYEVDDVISPLVYTGEEHNPAVKVYKNGQLCDEYEAVYTDNVGAGTATVSYTVGTDPMVRTATFEILKADYDVSSVTFSDATVVENGDIPTLGVSGTLPSGVTVSYLGAKSEPGVYTVTAVFSGDYENYNAIPDMTATLTVKRASLSTVADGMTITLYSPDGFAPELRLSAAPTEERSGLTAKNIGSYKLTFNVGKTGATFDGNYSVTVDTGEEYAGKKLTVSVNGKDIPHSVQNGLLSFDASGTAQITIAYENDFPLVITVVLSVIVLELALLLITLIRKSRKRATSLSVCPITLLSLALYGHQRTAVIILLAVAVALLIANVLLFTVKRKKKPTLTESNLPSSSEAELTAAEVTEASDKKAGFKIIARYKRSFLAKLIQASDETKQYYSDLKNSVLSYKKTRARLSWNYESVNAGRRKILKFVMKGKSLCLYLALDPSQLEGSKYRVFAAAQSRQSDLRCGYKITSARKAGYAKELIALACAGLELTSRQNTDYRVPYEDTDALVEKGLIKQLLSKESYAELKNVLPTLREGQFRGSVSASEVSGLIPDEAAAAFTGAKAKAPAKSKRAVVNVDTLSDAFAAGESVTIAALKEKGLVPRSCCYVKLLARGTIDKPLNVELQDYSIDAVKMILITGGSIK